MAILCITQPNMSQIAVKVIPIASFNYRYCAKSCCYLLTEWLIKDYDIQCALRWYTN